MKVFSSTYDLLLFLIEEKGLKKITYSGDALENISLSFDEPTQSEVEKLFPISQQWDLFYERLEDELFERVSDIDFCEFEGNENFNYFIVFDFFIVKDPKTDDKYIEAKLTHESADGDEEDAEYYIDLEEYFCTHNLNDDIKIPEYNSFSKKYNFLGLKDGLEYTI